MLANNFSILIVWKTNKTMEERNAILLIMLFATFACIWYIYYLTRSRTELGWNEIKFDEVQDDIPSFSEVKECDFNDAHDELRDSFKWLSEWVSSE